jgi:hypothetical protein
MTEEFISKAEPILRAAQGISDVDRADLFDAYHESENANDLAGRLQSVEGLSPDIASKLIAAKHSSEPVPSNLDRAVEAIHSVAKLDPQILEVAESHPVVMRGLVSAATKEQA